MVNRECPDWCRWHGEELDAPVENVHRSDGYMLGLVGATVHVWLQSASEPEPVGIWLGFDATNGSVLSPADARMLADWLRNLADHAELNTPS